MGALQVLDKSKPEDGLPGIAGRQVQLGDHETIIPGLLNGQGNKVCSSGKYTSPLLTSLPSLAATNSHCVLQVRLTFKPAEQQVWIGSAATTQKGWQI